VGFFTTNVALARNHLLEEAALLKKEKIKPKQKTTVALICVKQVSSAAESDECRHLFCVSTKEVWRKPFCKLPLTQLQ